MAWGLGSAEREGGTGSRADSGLEFPFVRASADGVRGRKQVYSGCAAVVKQATAHVDARTQEHVAREERQRICEASDVELLSLH